MQLAVEGLAELVRVIEGLESREAARDALAALGSRPALEVEFAFYVHGARDHRRVCLRLDASTTTAHNLLGVCTHFSPPPQYRRKPCSVERSPLRLGEVTFEYDVGKFNDGTMLGELSEFHDRYTFVPRLYDGAMCTPQRGDVYVMPQRPKGGRYRVCIRTDEGACFDAYKIGTVTEGIDALLGISTFTEGIPLWSFDCPLFELIQRALNKCRTATADELYAIYCATPVQGAMTQAQFRRALILCSPSADGPVELLVGSRRWDSIDFPTSPV
jgi:hypothetical protein